MRLLRILQSRSLPCHCFVGVYETYDGRTVTIIEEPGRGCPVSLHRPGVEIETPPPELVMASAVTQEARRV